VLSFAVDGVHPHDVGTLLNQKVWRCVPVTIVRNR